MSIIQGSSHSKTPSPFLRLTSVSIMECAVGVRSCTLSKALKFA